MSTSQLASARIAHNNVTLLAVIESTKLVIGKAMTHSMMWAPHIMDVDDWLYRTSNTQEDDGLKTAVFFEKRANV